GNAVASPAGPAYFGGGTTIGMALVWGHIAGETAGTQAQGVAATGVGRSSTPPPPPASTLGPVSSPRVYRRPSSS
ncbi:MAG TPA: hypothetical protein VIX41_13665, partial [Acidimicrobiales bacterium]